MSVPLLLAIDTSCDETSVAVTRGLDILSNVVSSQVRFHKKYGGVVPFLAQRLHSERINAIVDQALVQAGISAADIEGVAVTYGPGLAPALQVGLEKAKELAAAWKVPLYAVDHMAGHIASAWPRAKDNLSLPALVVLISGGHTELVVMQAFGSFQIVGRTLDDALGEAYDKVAVMLGLGYPGGKLVAQLAATGNPARFPLPIPMRQSGDCNLSYSGLKTAVRYLIRDLEEQSGPLDAQAVADVAASFEQSAQAALETKVQAALKRYPNIKSLLVAGGVAANAAVRKRLRRVAKEARVDFIGFPRSLKLCGDNAAMIGFAAYLGMLSGQRPVLDKAELDRVPYLSLEDWDIYRST